MLITTPKKREISGMWGLPAGALAGRADAIVTGNVKHFVPRRGSMAVAVLTPRQFVDRMRR